MDDDRDELDPFDDPLALSTPAWSAAGSLDADESLPAPTSHPFETTEPVRYALGGELGRGGMGRVTAARDRRLNRDVAMKEVRADSPQSQRRLAQEAWITAKLEHPGIVAVYDAGVRADGTRFYTMQLIRGRSLEDAIASAGEHLDDRLRLLRHFLDACQATAFAHSVGIIHRDLKPANLMVGEFGETQVVDWGLARPVTAELGQGWGQEGAGIVPEAHAAQTRLGAVVGTPAYMSPEQALGQPADERCDVWCLGGVLYYILSGRPPFADSSADEALRALASGSVPDVRGAAPDAPAELVAICQHALARDPRERYSNAGELATDLSNYLDGRRVDAHEYTPFELLRRLVGLYRTPLLVAGVALAVITIVAVLATRRVVGERNRAQEAEATTKAALAETDRQLSRALSRQAVDAHRIGATAEAEVLAIRALELAESPAARGVLAATAMIGRPALEARSELPPCPSPRLSTTGEHALCVLPGEVSLWSLFPTAKQWSVPVAAASGAVSTPMGRVALVDRALRLRTLDLLTGRELREPTPFLHTNRFVFGKRLLMGFHSRGAHIVDLIDGRAHELPVDCDQDLRTATMAADESMVAVLCGSGRLELYRPFGEPQGHVDINNRAVTDLIDLLVWLPSGTLLSGDTSGRIGTIDPKTGAIGATVRTGLRSIRAVRRTPGSDQVALLGDRGGVALFDGVRELARFPARWGRDSALSADGRAIVVLGPDARRFAIEREPATHRIPVSVSGLASGAISDDGSMVAANRGDGVISAYRLPSAVPHGHFASGAGVVKRGAFDRSRSRYVYVKSVGGRQPVLDVASWTAAEPRWGAIGRRLSRIRGDDFATASYGWGIVQLQGWRAPDTAVLTGHRFVDMACTRAGEACALLEEQDSGIYLWRPAAPSMEPPPLLVDGAAVAVDLVAHPGLLVVAHRDGVRLVDSTTGKERSTIRYTAERTLDVALSPDEQLIATAHRNATARLWSAPTRTLLAVLKGHTERVPYVEFARDGRWLLTASWDGQLRRWSTVGLQSDPAQLAASIRARWGMTVEDAMGALGP